MSRRYTVATTLSADEHAALVAFAARHERSIAWCLKAGLKKLQDDKKSPRHIREVITDELVGNVVKTAAEAVCRDNGGA